MILRIPAHLNQVRFLGMNSQQTAGQPAWFGPKIKPVFVIDERMIPLNGGVSH
jgi:hypothetical protein